MKPWDVKADVLIPIVGDPTFEGPLDELDRRARWRDPRALAGFKEVSGKRYSTTLAASGELPAGRLVIVGAGEAAKIDREVVVRVGASAVRRLGGRVVRSLAVWLDPLVGEGIGDDAAVAAELLARGVVEGSYDPKSIYREEAESAPPKLDELILVVPGDRAVIQAAGERGVIIGEGANTARTLSNWAANDVSPEVLADEAQAIAERHGLWSTSSSRSVRPARHGHVHGRRPRQRQPAADDVMRSGDEGQHDSLDRHLAIVGKGVCFDSRRHQHQAIRADGRDEDGQDRRLHGHRHDGDRRAAGARTPLLGLAPAVENMPGPHSTRPGDIVTALNGKKVDITNTDAEGRLILGDAMTYAERLGATHIVDVATLTGAVAERWGTWSPGRSGSRGTGTTRWPRPPTAWASATGNCR